MARALRFLGLFFGASAFVLFSALVCQFSAIGPAPSQPFTGVLANHLSIQGYDASSTYDWTAHSLQARTNEARPPTAGNTIYEGQETVAAATGHFSVLFAKSVAANTESGLLKLATEDSWGNPATLGRHFIDHGADFGVATADEYASQASNFLQRGLQDGLPTKIDSNGVIRVYDPNTNTFGAFNADGTTRTFFKPSSPTYWDRQPGSAPAS